MTSQQIEYVLTLAEQGSFSKAARKLSVTQPSLSQYIINIENQLGTPLFDRSTTLVKLTAAGQAYVRTVAQIKALEESLRNEISDMSDLRTGSLRIGSTIFRASCMLPGSITEFCHRYSGVNVSVTEAGSQQLLEAVLSGEIDLFIGAVSFDPKLFEAEPLADERLLLAVPEKSELVGKLTATPLTAQDIRGSSMKFLTAKPVELSQLAGEKIIVCDDGGEFTSEKIDSIFSTAGMTPNYALKVRSVESAFAFVKAEFGSAFLPDSLVRFGDVSKHPVYFVLPDALAKTDISLVYRKNGYITKAAREYSLLLKQLVSYGTWRTS